MVEDFTMGAGDKTQENVKHPCSKEEREIYGISDSPILEQEVGEVFSPGLSCRSAPSPRTPPALPPQTPCPEGNVSRGPKVVKFFLLSNHGLSRCILACAWWRWTTGRPADSLPHPPRPWRKPSHPLSAPELGPGKGLIPGRQIHSQAGHASTLKLRMD